MPCPIMLVHAIRGWQNHRFRTGSTAHSKTISTLSLRSRILSTARPVPLVFRTIHSKRLPTHTLHPPCAAKYLLQNSIWWIELAGLDGLRVDTFPYVSRAFWQQWHAGLRTIYPNLSTIGEVFHPDPNVTSFFVGGVQRYDGIDSGLSTVFDFPMFFTIRDVL